MVGKHACEGEGLPCAHLCGTVRYGVSIGVTHPSPPAPPRARTAPWPTGTACAAPVWTRVSKCVFACVLAYMLKGEDGHDQSLLTTTHRPLPPFPCIAPPHLGGPELDHVWRGLEASRRLLQLPDGRHAAPARRPVARPAHYRPWTPERSVPGDGVDGIDRQAYVLVYVQIWACTRLHVGP